MKKFICVLLTLALCMSALFAAAETKKISLGDFSSRLQKKDEVTPEAPAAEADEEGTSYGPALRISDPFFQKIRSSAYMQEDSYSREANVMIELKNISGRTLYPDSATIAAYDAAGTLIDEENYASCGPDMVGNGESLFIWEWFYGFDVPVSEISYFEVTIETETSSYRTYEKIDAQGLVSDGIAYALIDNTTEDDIYGLSATLCVENDEGVLLDVTQVSTGSGCGIFPGSVMILRDNARDYANDAYLTEGNVTVHALHQKD